MKLFVENIRRFMVVTALVVVAAMTHVVAATPVALHSATPGVPTYGTGTLGGGYAARAVVTAQAATMAVTADAEDVDRLDVNVRDGMLVITVNRPTAIKIFSILGQLVTQRTVPAGVTRIKLPARGIYILKAGTITRRVTI